MASPGNSKKRARTQHHPRDPSQPITPDSLQNMQNSEDVVIDLIDERATAVKDPFRQYYLDQIQILVAKEAGLHSLHDLLKMASPTVTLEQVNNVTQRQKLLKILKLRIHPDKHPNANLMATKLFQDVQSFYESCCKRMDLHVVPPPTRSFSQFPMKFRVQMNWPYLNDIQPSSQNVRTEQDLARLMACRCINARGAIAHGKETGLLYNLDNLEYDNVEDFLDAASGGIRRLDTIDDIKNELMVRGPVISASFQLSQGFSGKTEFAGSFLMSQVGKIHPLMIIGWKFTKFGDVWIVHHLDTQNEHIIAFGHFQIDACCVAPHGTFENTRWQPGPYFDYDFSDWEGWRESSKLELEMKSIDLERLGSMLDMGFSAAIKEKTQFEICNGKRKAHSRTCFLEEVQWDHEVKAWKVTAEVVN